MDQFEGTYAMMGFTLTVKQDGERLTAAVPGVPAGYEILLEPAGEKAFKLLGGPADGATAVFLMEDSVARAIKVGDFELERVVGVSGGGQASPQPLLLPGMNVDDEKRGAFESLVEGILDKGDGGWIDYELPYPKQEFLRYASERDLFIFHGSGNPDIALFQPVRKSFELHDPSARGNLPAVYGTHDGIWPMFFAIVDRENLRGSIRNGVSYYYNEQGERLAVYQFSINRDMLASRPWRKGTLYLLPRASFTRLELAEGALSNEWASTEPIAPLGKLALEPEDFPFLAQIGGHDDSELIRMGALSKEVLAAVTQADQSEDGLALTLAWTQELGRTVLAFIELQREFMPAAKYGLSFEPGQGDVILRIQGPPAYMQVLSGRLGELLR